jgi:hypothetical protein
MLTVVAPRAVVTWSNESVAQTSVDAVERGSRRKLDGG